MRECAAPTDAGLVPDGEMYENVNDVAQQTAEAFIRAGKRHRSIIGDVFFLFCIWLNLVLFVSVKAAVCCSGSCSDVWPEFT